MIKFVREYKMFPNDATTYYDVIHKAENGRRSWRLYTNSDLPKTVEKYISEATAHKQYDSTFKREEIIYEKGEN